MNASGPVLVVGGGPAGIMAALAAARTGARVVLLEKNRDLGRKLLLTGNGRCNLSNQAGLESLIANMPGNGRFLYGAFSRFGPEALIRYLGDLGLSTRIEADGRVFPAGDRAQDVLDSLRGALARAGVSIRTGIDVAELIREEQHVSGVRSTSGIMRGKAVVIATGGMSYPQTGSTGDGYRLAASAGHRIVTPLPSLVPLETVEPWTRDLQGLALPRVGAAVFAGRRKNASETGEMLFTHFGVSGPLILRLSRGIVRALAADETPVVLHLDLHPAGPLEALEARVLEALANKGRRLAVNALEGLLPSRLAPLVLAFAGISPAEPAHQLTRDARRRLCRLMKDLPLTVKRARPLSEAYVTAGGVAVAEIDPRTMASRLVQGLYFAGEVMDVDGFTGGFNLQAAFSTGFIAGEAAGGYGEWRRAGVEE